MMRKLMLSLGLVPAIAIAVATTPHIAAAPHRADVVIYGATPAGIAAATAVIRSGKTAILVEPTTHIGGMITGGIAVTDTGTPQFVGGIAREFFQQIASAEKDSRAEQHVMHFRGKVIPWYEPAVWDLEARVAKRIFEAWTQKDNYPVLLDRRIRSVKKTGARIVGITLTDGSEIEGKEFIDASYEGDLLARAGVGSTYGRESSAQYNEKLAGVREPHFLRNYTDTEYATPTREYQHHGQFGADIPARENGKLLWGVEPGPIGRIGSADKLMQAYCYRLIATQRPDLKMDWWKPAHYDATHYEVLLRYIQQHPQITFTRLVHLGPIPNGKWDLNASGPFSIDYVGGNRNYPDLPYAQRDAMLDDHKDYEQGFFWFLAHDTRVPRQLRDEVNSWGPAKDEWTDNDGWPTQVYIREARRMIGDYVMTEDDIVNHNTKPDSVGLGSFVLDSHWVRRLEMPNGAIRVEGHLDESINLAKAPYEIAYRSLTPKASEAENLLVPVAISATHVAICTIRMEPVYMILGHSAGVAAAMAIDSKRSVQTIDIPTLLAKLKQQGQVLHREDALPPLPVPAGGRNRDTKL